MVKLYYYLYYRNGGISVSGQNRTKKAIKRKKKERALFFISFLIFLLLLPSIYLINKHYKNNLESNRLTNNTPKSNSNNPKASDGKNAETTEVNSNAEKPKEILLSFAGDCTLGYDDKTVFSMSLPSVLKKHGSDYSYFFKNVADYFKNDDYTTVNLETTFTDAVQKAEKQFNFKASAEYAAALKLGGIEAVNISNNHIYDYLQKGFNDTKTALTKEGIGYFGEGNKLVKEINGTKFGFLGYTGWNPDKVFLNRLQTDIQSLKKDGCIVIINFHWGQENSYNPNSTQKLIAHFAIDNGADLIIGHHPHVIEGIEQYKGKIICYSLGNFCFGGNVNPSDKDTFIVQTKLKVTGSALNSIGLRVIPCSISSVNYTNDYCPTPMTGQKKTALLNKLNKLSFNLNFKVNDDFSFIDVNN